MSRSKHNDETCSHCGLVYRDLRTGLTYPEVRMLLWVGDPDYKTWKYKRRHTVLGLWGQLKLVLWREHLEFCEKQAMYCEAQAQLEEELSELVDIVRKELGDDVPERRPYEDLSDVPF